MQAQPMWYVCAHRIRSGDPVHSIDVLQDVLPAGVHAVGAGLLMLRLSPHAP